MKCNIFIILICLCLMLMACSKISDTQSYMEDNTENVQKDDVPQYIEDVFYRFIEWQKKNPSENICIQGPLTLDGSFWTFNVIELNSGFDFSRQVRFYAPEGENAEHSFSLTLGKDQKTELRDYIKAMVYAVSSDISTEECVSISESLMNSYQEGISDVCVLGQYKVFIAEAHIVSGYTVGAVYYEEINPKVDLELFSEIDYSILLQGTPELSEDTICFKFSGTVTEYTVNYPNATIIVKDALDNIYKVSATYQNTLDNIVEGQSFVFYTGLAKYKDTIVNCGLRYYEIIEP